MAIPDPDLVFVGRRWQCPVAAADWPDLSHATVWFEPADGDRTARPTEGQRAALRHLIEQAGVVRGLVSDALAADYPARLADSDLEGDAAAAAVAAGPPANSRLSQVVVWRSGAVGFDFLWDFDEEHGLGVRWAEEKVVAVGVAEVAHS